MIGRGRIWKGESGMRTLILMAIFAVMPVGAQVTYDYTGQPMTLSGETFYPGPGDCCEQTYTEPYTFLGDVVLAKALNPNQVNQQVVPLAYTWNDPGTAPGGFVGGLFYSAKIPYGSELEPVGPNPVAWPGAPPPGFGDIGGIPTLDFSTANGKITSFSMTFGGSFSDGEETLTISSAGDSYNSHIAIPDCDCGGYWNGSNSVGGAWTRVRAPEIDPSGVAAALTLLIGGGLVLRGRRT
jgi:hypothetical protein